MTIVRGIEAQVPVTRTATASRAGPAFLTDAPANTAGPAPIASPHLTALLGLQETGTDTERKRRRGHRRVCDILACLAALQRAMVAGGDAAGVVRELSALQADEHPTGDPVLDDLLRSARLRARIEMARYGL